MGSSAGPAEKPRLLFLLSFFLGKKLKLEEQDWDADQLILSRAILESKLCYFPSSSPLWSTLRLDPVRIEDTFDDQICFHGQDIGNCNKKQKYVQSKNCLWWHFWPNERRNDIIKKYLEILKNSIYLPFEI